LPLVLQQIQSFDFVVKHGNRAVRRGPRNFFKLEMALQLAFLPVGKHWEAFVTL